MEATKAQHKEYEKRVEKAKEAINEDIKAINESGKPPAPEVLKGLAQKFKNLLKGKK
jgi:hypothetical protein